MAWVLPEIAVTKILAYGIKQLRQDRAAFERIFCQLTQDELDSDYGTAYKDDIWKWFSSNKLPVVRAWQLNPQQVPCFSIRLASESEDQDKAAFSDIAEVFDDGSESGTGVFTVMVDIGIHANKAGDHVLWMYYIASYILFKHKAMAHRFGMKLHTFSASDYNKDAGKAMENVWTRWMRFKCTTQNFWEIDSSSEDIESINTYPAIGLEEASDVATSLDVDINTVSTTSNDGLIASRVDDFDGDDDVNI